MFREQLNAAFVFVCVFPKQSDLFFFFLFFKNRSEFSKWIFSFLLIASIYGYEALIKLPVLLQPQAPPPSQEGRESVNTPLLSPPDWSREVAEKLTGVKENLLGVPKLHLRSRATLTEY